MIAIVDYGIGNLGSVTKGFRHAGADTILTGDPDVLRAASALVLPGRVRRLPAGLPVPHMGWNVLRPRRPHPLLDDIASGDYVYFVHSYYCDAASEVVLAETDYGLDFAAVVGRGPVLGMQFHPEKSQAVGLRLVANFVRLCASERAIA